jgi:PIN domain nuclease of toxin-antitoxin system
LERRRLIVVDTHVLVWAVEDNVNLGRAARETIERAAAATGVLVPAITPWEIAMLVHKGRLSLAREIHAWMANVLDLPGIRLAPITPSIAIDSVALPGSFHADPADRLIIATARDAGFPLLTSDQAILRYGSAGHVAVMRADR